MDYSHIIDSVYQGGSIDTCPAEIQAVLNLQLEHRDTLDPAQIVAYCQMPVGDGAFPGLLWLQAAVDYVSACQRAGWKTLVHCGAGISRAGMVSTAYLMYTRGLSPSEALKFVKSKRECTQPNPDFMNGLISYEAYLINHKHKPTI